MSRVAETARRDPGFHPSTSSPFNLRTLYVLCRILRPAWVVETGVASGASSWVLLTALSKNGKGGLRSIDLPPSQWEPAKSAYKEIDPVSLPAHRKPGWLVPEPLRGRWQLILGDAKAELPRLLEGLGRIELFYHDAEHTREAMLREFRAAWAHLASGGALTSDDVGWNTAFDEFCAEVLPKEAGRWFSFGLVLKP
ncbi:MAG: class I SAM-dependent methyltransferase [Elusimicrobia bacterium]|nr:class I SAM-dependent methyltransferase [Elusimicrobiota bacterium]